MSLLDRIANYFKEWDGIDETAPKMELSIHELRYIADLNVERCRLIRQLNEANLKTEKIRNKAIDETCLKIYNYLLVEIEWNRVLVEDWEALAEEFKEIAEQMKGGAE